jgi:transcriptional regulator with XRE-family HTH domain
MAAASARGSTSALPVSRRTNRAEHVGIGVTPILGLARQKAKIGQGYISDLERGRRKGTTAALKKIADALKVPLDLIA